MSAEAYPAPADLLWELTRKNSSFLVKRKTAGGYRLSRDPLNLQNVHSRKNSGAINPKAIGIVPSEKGGISLLTKNKKGGLVTSQYKSSTTSRKAYGKIANSTAKKGYRSDLRGDAISRASALIRSYRKPVKPTKESKPRGSKAKKAASAGSADL